ncbi:MAG: hypothetical protein IJ660_02460 [Alphaproteobacteria bacterium]|nr:hypothetical protein [Alphaproteobacteria bacterium]
MKEVTIEIMRNILSKTKNTNIPDTNLEEKKLIEDLGLDEIDICMISMDIEITCGLSIPHLLFARWIDDSFSLTVKQIIDDCNNLIS